MSVGSVLIGLQASRRDGQGVTTREFLAPLDIQPGEVEATRADRTRNYSRLATRLRFIECQGRDRVNRLLSFVLLATGGDAMSSDHCPHCGSKLPIVRDAFCAICSEPLDEPPEVPRTAEERGAFREKIEREAKENLGLIWRIFRLFGR